MQHTGQPTPNSRKRLRSCDNLNHPSLDKILPCNTHEFSRSNRSQLIDITVHRLEAGTGQPSVYKDLCLRRNAFIFTTQFTKDVITDKPLLCSHHQSRHKDRRNTPSPARIHAVSRVCHPTLPTATQETGRDISCRYNSYKFHCYFV